MGCSIANPFKFEQMVKKREALLRSNQLQLKRFAGRRVRRTTAAASELEAQLCAHADYGEGARATHGNSQAFGPA